MFVFVFVFHYVLACVLNRICLNGLEKTRLIHIQPQELLLPIKGLKKETEKLLTDFASRGVRVERFQDDLTFEKALVDLSNFHSSNKKNQGTLLFCFGSHFFFIVSNKC